MSVHILEPGLFKTELFNFDLILKNIYKDFEAAPKEIQEYYGRKCLEDCKNQFLSISINSYVPIYANDNI